MEVVRLDLAMGIWCLVERFGSEAVPGEWVAVVQHTRTCRD
jgi:hypothetical protein